MPRCVFSKDEPCPKLRKWIMCKLMTTLFPRMLEEEKPKRQEIKGGYIV